MKSAAAAAVTATLNDGINDVWRIFEEVPGAAVTA